MHRLPSKRSIFRLRLAAFLLVAKCLLAPLAAYLFLHSYATADLQMAYLGLGTLALVAVVVPAQWIVSARANCPLCFAPVLAGKKCATHRKSQPLLGSHQLRVATEILLANSFRCPYCGEPTLLELRKKWRGRRSRGVDRTGGLS